MKHIMTKIAKEILEQKADEEQIRLLNEAIKQEENQIYSEKCNK